MTYFLAFGFKKKPWKIVKTHHSIPGYDMNSLNIKLEAKYAKKGMLSFIAISDSIRSCSLDLYPNSLTTVIYNGIPLPNHINLCEPKVYDLVIVASLERVKNHVLLFRVIKDIAIKYPKITLAVVGDGTLMHTYKEYVSANDLSGNICFLGQIDDVGPVLSRSKIFILCSLREGNPISILEAMSYGLPIIAPKVGGIPDVLEDNENGKLFDVNDAQQLEEAILDTLNDQGQISRISDNNIQKSRKFSLETTNREYVAFFRDVGKLG